METDFLMEMQAAEHQAEKVSGGWQDRISNAGEHYSRMRDSARQQFYNLQATRERAAFTRWKAIENLDKYLIEFESNFIKAGGKVIWAQDITDALEEISLILNKSTNRTISGYRFFCIECS